MGSVVHDDRGLVDLLIDLEESIGQGLNDAQIAMRLGLGELAVVAQLRERLADLGSNLS